MINLTIYQGNTHYNEVLLFTHQIGRNLSLIISSVDREKGIVYPSRTALVGGEIGSATLQGN